LNRIQRTLSARRAVLILVVVLMCEARYVEAPRTVIEFALSGRMRELRLYRSPVSIALPADSALCYLEDCFLFGTGVGTSGRGWSADRYPIHPFEKL
jgi:hypothetical protein